MQSPLSRYIVIAKRWAWLVILGVVICGGTTFIVSKLMHPVYTAESTLYLSAAAGSSPYESSMAAIQLAPAYAPQVTSQKVLAPVASKYGLTVTQLTLMIKVTAVSNTPNITVDVSAGDPNTAANIANAIGNSFTQYMATLMGGTIQVTVFQASPPVNPTRPLPTQNAMFGALAGLGLSIALIVLFEWIDDRLT